MKAELETEGPFPGIVLIPETKEEKETLKKLCRGKHKCVWYWDAFKVILAPTEVE